MMKHNKLIPRKFTRREFLKLGARGVALTVLTGGTLAAMSRFNPSQAAPAPPAGPLAAALPPGRPSALTTRIHLAATDGFISLPGRRIFADPATRDGEADPFALPDGHTGVYVFGFSRAPVTDTFPTVPPPPVPLTPPDFGQAIFDRKGKVQVPSPIIAANADTDLYITLTNLGLLVRFDLDDSHTIHWHGFRNPHTVFDGVPEVSISVPPARDFPYFFRPKVLGTYMYHCHFEDTEHVQMGMDGAIYIQRLDSFGVPIKQAYDDSSTAFDRQYTLLLNEIDTTPHDGLQLIQEFVWSDYDPNYWVINGRSYPDTILSDSAIVGTELEERQPTSSLIQALPGEDILLRFINLGYEQQAMQLLGIRMRVVGQDATFLGPLEYETTTLYIGPGETRDVIFTAPGYDGTNLPVFNDGDGAGDYNVYWLKNHHPQRLVNGRDDHDNLVDTSLLQPVANIFGTPVSVGGQITQVRVYGPGNSVGTQIRANQTFPAV